MWLIGVLLSVVSAEAGDCDVGSEQLQATIDDALLAFAVLDAQGFEDAGQQAEEQLGCVQSVLSRNEVASYHRLKGIAAFYDGDTPEAELSFHVALRLEPAYQLSSRVAPEGGPLQRVWSAARTRAVQGQQRPLNLSRGIESWVNGSQATVRSDTFPAVIQFRSGDEGMVSVWLPADRPLPVSVDTLVDLEEDAEEKKRVKRRKKGAGWWVAAGVAAGTSAALFTTSAVTRSRFDQSPNAADFEMVNGTYWGAVGAGVAALGLTSVAFATTF